MCFSDYMRPAIRLAAFRSTGNHVFTHDSIGLGEDGPTHQPVEHLAALRAIPNLFGFVRRILMKCARPGPGHHRRHAPTVLALTDKTSAHRSIYLCAG
jgi:transketolase